MAEHDERNFEHELSEKLKMLDKNIKIPEIPDAQDVFEKAKKKKDNTIPFRKYSKYVVAAAAVVLICVSVPVMADALSNGFSAEEANDGNYSYSIFDGVTADSSLETEAVDEYNLEPSEAQEAVEQPDGEEKPSPGKTAEDQKTASSGDTSEKSRLTIALNDYFKGYSAASSSAESSSADSFFVPGDDVRTIEEYINKKRTIEITVEKDSVSVIIHDNSTEEEMINAFWVEGTYQSSYLDGERYIISLSKKVTPEEFESGYYLPMAGDANGIYTIPEDSVFISENITKGVISLSVEINVGTGEYQIYASLV